MEGTHFQTLSHNCVLVNASCLMSQRGLESIKRKAVRRAPVIDNLQRLVACGTVGSPNASSFAAALGLRFEERHHRATVLRTLEKELARTIADTR